MSNVRGFRWQDEVPDEPLKVLAAIEKMLEHLNTLPKGSYHVRRWPMVERRTNFDSESRTAIVTCRFTLIEKDQPIEECRVAFRGFEDHGRGVG